MTKTADILLARMQAQFLLKHEKRTPADIVKSLGGIQGQDYSGGEWSTGLRIPGSTIHDIDKAIEERQIVRTWAMRGTLHFLASSDIRWILELLAPGIIARLRTRYEDLGLDEPTFRKAEKLLAKSLKGRNQLTRRELVDILGKNGISCEGQRAVFILHRASLDRVICFGVNREKQETYALFDEWVPNSKTFEREEALAELARRYFAAYGPATIQDYMWWSGIKGMDAKTGLEDVKTEFEPALFEGRTYWMPRRNLSEKRGGSATHLLPPFDSFLIGYKDRGVSIAPSVFERLRTGGMPDATILVDGKVTGTWKRTLKKDSVMIETRKFRSFNKKEEWDLEKAVNRYAEFVGKKPERK